MKFTVKFTVSDTKRVEIKFGVKVFVKHRLYDVDAEDTPAALSHPRTDYQVREVVSRGIHVRRPPHIMSARQGLIFRRSSSCPLRVTGACDIDSNFVYLYTPTHLFTVARATGEWGCRRAGDGRYTMVAHERYRSRCTENRTLTLS